jgi:hypothetical protein
MENIPHKPQGERDMPATPTRIQQAKLEGDTEFLRAAGRKGAHKAAENRRRNADIEDLYAQRRHERDAASELQRMQDAGETILPLSTYE